MTLFLRTLMNMSITAAFVAVVVFLLRLVLKGRTVRQMVCLLWLLVFARLLIPVTLQSPVSLVPDMDLNAPAPVVSTQPEAVPTLPVNTSPVVTAPPNVSAPAVTYPVQNPAATISPNVSTPAPTVTSPAAEPPVTENPAPFPWAAVLTAVWAIGVCAMLVYGVSSYLSIRRRLRFAIRSKEGWWEDPHLRSPFILGLVRPKIYLPCHMAPATRQFILCHERAHIRRGDHIIKPICWLALALHWFNPLAWVAFLLLSRDIEVACDEKVLQELGSEVKADYSATLLALATNGRFPAPTPLAFGEGDAKTRIKSVLSFKKPTLWVTIAAIVVAVVAAMCLLTDPVDKFDPNNYTTLDCYPGLYFEERTDEATGEATVKAYALEDGKPVLVAGWSDQPADNVVILIHPGGKEEVILATRWDITARYEQYLVDYMMEQDENWAQRYVEESDRLVTVNSALWGTDLHAVLGGSATPEEMTDFMGGVAYTPELNLLFFWNGTAQVLPLQTSIAQDARSVKPSFMDLTGDGKERLDILWAGGRKLYSPAPSGTLLFEGDSLITYIWDGGTWTAHDSLKTLAYAAKPVSFDAEKQVITVTCDPNGGTDIAGTTQHHFSIPEELGHVVTVSISGQATITPRTDEDQSFQMAGGEQGTLFPADREYDLTYAVFALPQWGLSDADLVHVLDLTASMKWNALTEEFEITFTGATEANKSVIGEGTVVLLPEGSELLASLPEHGLYLYTQQDSINGGLCSEFHLALDGQEVLFAGRHMEEEDVLTHYVDVTGDSIADPIVLLVPGMGTGTINHEVHIFDGATLEEYPNVAETVWDRAAEPYTFTADENNFYITADGLDIALSKADILAYWAEHPAYGDIHFPDRIGIGQQYRQITVKDGMLCVINQCMVGDHWQHYGQLETYLTIRDGQLTVVKTVYRTHEGEEITQNRLTPLASLPEEQVFLYMDQDGSFFMEAYGHYGPVTSLNSQRYDLKPDTLADLRAGTVDNLSGPDIECVFFTMQHRSVTVPISHTLMWNEEQNRWEECPYVTTLSTLPRDIVTPETYPNNPEWYYKVAGTVHYDLYARNHGQEILLAWGNLYHCFDRTAHTGRMNLPVMKELDSETVAVISEVNSGTGVSTDELVVYVATPILAADYRYDWRELAAAFNRSNTLTYDKQSNSLTLNWNGQTYSSGRLGSDLSVAYNLEDGFAGALIATGDIIRFTANQDGTFTVRMETSIGRGNNGSFSDYQAGWFWQYADEGSYVYPLSIGSTGLDLVWTVRFTGKDFEVVSPLSIDMPPTPE